MKDPLEYLEDEDYALKFGWTDKESYGDTNWDKKCIRVNMVLLVVRTVLHEYFHVVLNTNTEGPVEEAVDRWIKRHTIKEIHELYQKILHKL